MANWRIDKDMFSQPVGGLTGTVLGFIGTGKHEKRVLLARIRTSGQPDISMWLPNKPDLAKARDYAELLAEFLRVVDGTAA